jgi:parvulin-like peptidyl-prolyl isomerase
LGINSGITKFAFEGSVGEMGPHVYRVTGGYAVVQISGIAKEGIRPYDEVKEVAKNRALREKKMAVVQKTAQDVRSRIKPGDSLNVVSSLDTRIVVQETNFFTPNAAVAGIGRDLKFIGAAARLNVDEISQPVEGQRGYYLIQVTAKQQPDTAIYNASSHDALLQTIMQEKRNQFVNDWLNTLVEKADIEDHRDRFYR